MRLPLYIRSLVILIPWTTCMAGAQATEVVREQPSARLDIHFTYTLIQHIASANTSGFPDSRRVAVTTLGILKQKAYACGLPVDSDDRLPFGLTAQDADALRTRMNTEKSTQELLPAEKSLEEVYSQSLATLYAAHIQNKYTYQDSPACPEALELLSAQCQQIVMEIILPNLTIKIPSVATPTKISEIDFSQDDDRLLQLELAAISTAELDPNSIEFCNNFIVADHIPIPSTGTNHQIYQTKLPEIAAALSSDQVHH